MQNLEKNFGSQVTEVALVSAEDLMSLQIMDDILEEDLMSGCTFCTWTCWNTAAGE
ncbi:MAG: hypothetical protein JO215_16000 [Ktedonobacteraceae bacterium]|nr:hypothetical protein [Ktedonobacteraceae bacterium]MBV9615357.1 hypothetical protein [Ktedonobacteraceae bacterium]